MIKIGTLITCKYSQDIEIIVSIDNSETVPVYEAKWVNIDGSLSKGSEFIFGSQINDYYNVVEDEITETIVRQKLSNMDSAIASFYSSIYK